MEESDEIGEDSAEGEIEYFPKIDQKIFSLMNINVLYKRF